MAHYVTQHSESPHMAPQFQPRYREGVHHLWTTLMAVPRTTKKHHLQARRSPAHDHPSLDPQLRRSHRQCVSTSFCKKSNPHRLVMTHLLHLLNDARGMLGVLLLTQSMIESIESQLKVEWKQIIGRSSRNHNKSGLRRSSFLLTISRRRSPRPS